MKKPPIPIKVVRPHFPSSLARSRLFNLLDRKRSRPLVWITSPPGSGKTTLVASYVEKRRLACLWYQADASDEVATFFHYVGLAAKAFAPRYRTSLPAFTAEYRSDIGKFVRRYLQILCARLKPPATLVLDNWQELAPGSPVHEAVRDMASFAPARFNIIVVSRAPPPPAFARLYADEKIEVLEWPDMRLTLDEAREIGRHREKGEIDPDVLDRAYEQTEGWVAGLVLLLDRPDGSNVPVAASDDVGPVLSDYFAEEVLRKSDAQTRAVMLETALLPKMTAEMAIALTGNPQAGRVLNELSRKNYFTLKHVGSDPLYEYHPLFRGFLLAQGPQSLGADACGRLQRRAGQVLEAAGQMDEAVAAYLEAHAWPEAAQAMRACAGALMSQGRHHTLDGWLNRLPAALRAESPWLLYWHAAARLPFDPAGARSTFAAAFESFREREDPSGLLLSWVGVVDTYIHEWNDFAPLDRWIAEFAELQRRYPGFPSEDVESAVTAAMFLALMYRQPQHPDIGEWEGRARNIVLSHPNLQLRMKVGSHLMLYHAWWQGDLAKVAMLLETLRPAASQRDIAPLFRVAWYAMTALYYRLTGDNARCVQLVDEGLALARQFGVRVWDFMLLVQGVYAALSEENSAEVSRYMAQMTPVADSTRFVDVCHYHFLSARRALSEDDLPGAAEHARLAVDMADRTGTPFSQAYANVALAEVLSEQQDLAGARHHLIEARRAAGLIGGKTVEYLCLLVEAHMLLHGDSPEALTPALEQCFAVGRERGMYSHAWWRSSVMTRLCAAALERGIEVDHVKTLIRRRGLTPERLAPAPPDWPWPIRVAAMGDLDVAVNGKRLEFGRKAQRRPLDLLTVLVALGGAELQIGRVVEALWLDVEQNEDTGQAAFDVTLHRLRKLLGHPDAVLVSGSKVSLNRRLVWVDALALDGLDIRDDSIGRAQDAIALYRGPFLREVDAFWAVALRDRLRKKFLRASLLVCGDLAQSGRYEEGVTLLERCLDVEELTEQFYIELIGMHLALNQRVEALRVYDRCKKVYARMLGILPSPEVESLINSIRAN